MPIGLSSTLQEKKKESAFLPAHSFSPHFKATTLNPVRDKSSIHALSLWHEPTMPDIYGHGQTFRLRRRMGCFFMGFSALFLLVQ